MTSADAKQDQLLKEIAEVQNRLLQLSRDWVVDPDTNIDRERRVLAAKKVIDWLLDDEERIYHRVHALEESLCMAEGEELAIADCADNASRRHGDPLPRELKNYLHEWATVAVPKRWESFCNDHRDGEPWLDPNDLNMFTRYLRDYLLTDKVFGQLVSQVQPVVGPEDPRRGRPAARSAEVRPHHSQRLPDEPRPQPRRYRKRRGEPGKGQGNGEEDFSRFGLMATLVKQWATRLPMALALGAGEHIKLPPGNMELIKILEPFESK